MGVCKFSPQLVSLYTAVVPIDLGFLNPEYPEPAESASSLRKQSYHMGQINQQPSRATHPSTGNPISFHVGFGLGFSSSCHNHVFCVFPWRPSTMSILVRQ